MQKITFVKNKGSSPILEKCKYQCGSCFAYNANNALYVRVSVADDITCLLTEYK